MLSYPKCLLPIHLLECLIGGTSFQSTFMSMNFRWIPIKRNDWFWIRHHIKVGMHVIVEILVSSVLGLHKYWYICERFKPVDLAC